MKHEDDQQENQQKKIPMKHQDDQQENQQKKNTNTIKTTNNKYK